MFDDILQGDDKDNVLVGNSGNEQLYAGKSILEGGNGSDIYSWFSKFAINAAKVNGSILIIRNYATDGVTDTVENPYISSKQHLGFEKSRNDLVIRPINKQHPNVL